MKRLTLSLLLICISFALAAHAQRALQPADILRIATPADPQISPDGTRIVYTLTTVEGDENRTTLWLAQTAAGVGTSPTRTVPLLPAGWSASNPRWSPDGKTLAFLAARDNGNGIWILSVNDALRTPRFVAPVYNTNFFITYAGEALAWSPDSRRLAYISTDVPDANARPNNATQPLVISRLQYKSRTAFSDDRRTHVFVTDIDRPAPRKLTEGDFYDHALTWNPNGREIAFLSNREPEAEAVNNSDIFAVDMDGRTRRITETKGCEYEPAWSPDGRLIAYTATKRDVTTIDSIAEDAHVWVIDADGKSAGRELTAAQDRRARSPRWVDEGRTVWFLANDRGLTHLCVVGLSDDKATAFAGLKTVSGGETQILFPVNSPAYRTSEQRRVIRSQITGFSVKSKSSPDLPLVAFTLTGAISPAEVWSGFGFFKPMWRITDHNRGISASLSFVEPEPISYNSFDNTPVQGWIMKPANFDANKRYPLILSVHGGPHGMYGYSFNSTFQAYTAAGYAVLFINPRGSNGYGQKFSDGTLKEWGGGDYKDLMAGIDEAVRRYSWIDRDRMGVTGGSYGGFMTNWIVTQTPRFKAAVAHASVSNLISFYGTSLYQDLIHAEFGGFPWNDYELLWRWSPIRYVAQVQTPVMFTHGEADNDVHITQAEEMYTALRRRGIEAVMVRYPGEGHGLRRPANRVDALTRTIEWFDRHLKN